MDAVDFSEHYEVQTDEEHPSLLSVVLDTNPRAWAALDPVLPLSRAIASILIFVNAHLAFSNANQVAVIAAHPNRSVWLYPSPQGSGREGAGGGQRRGAGAEQQDAAGDVDMTDAATAAAAAPANGTATPPTSSANKYPQFAQIESTVLSSLESLMKSTTADDLDTTTTQLSGALTLALCHHNKISQSFDSTATTASTSSSSKPNVTTSLPAVKGRILVVSVSDSEPSQYIPTMNAVFAAAHAQVAIDTLSLSGEPTFLQQACFNTGGTFVAAANPQGLLTYLMFGLVADTEARRHLVTPAHDTTDFRAACFCHGKVVDTGFVCSICLSIFCEVPEDAECLTCGTRLALGNYGSKPAVVPRKKKKKKRIMNGTREETGTPAGTPMR